MDPQLASRAEKLPCVASASAMKAMNSVRKYRNEDGAASKCSAGSFVPRGRAAAGGVTEDRTASTAPPPKSDAQKSRDASEPLFKKKSSAGKERKRREPSLPSDEDNSSNVEEDDGSSSEDADGYDRDCRQYNEDLRRWQENAHRNPPGDGGGDNPEEPPGGGGAGRGDGGGPPPSHRPEEMEINLVVNLDRRVSLMVTYRVPRLLKCFAPWLNLSKNRHDHLLRRSQRLKILTKIFPASVPIYAPT